MKSLQEVQDFYNNTLKDRLTALEAQRLTIRNKHILGISLLISPFIGIPLINKLCNIPNMGLLFLGGILLAIGGFIFIFLGNKKTKAYREIYKKQVVSEIVKMVDDSWVYQADSHISEGEFRQSRLFDSRIDRFAGDDLISGKIDKTDFRCSEIHSEYRTWEVDDDGKRKEKWHTTFKGLFFHADFNKNFNSQTWVVPNSGATGIDSTSILRQAKRVKLEDPQFEKIYEVYSTDQIEARYILTPAIMQAMSAIKKELKTKLYFSFINERVHCAMYFSKNLFEPRIMKSGVNYNDIEQMYKLFATNKIIIQELNLNTRIWTKA